MCTGARTSSVVPSPTCPGSLRPQHLTPQVFSEAHGAHPWDCRRGCARQHRARRVGRGSFQRKLRSDGAPARSRHWRRCFTGARACRDDARGGGSRHPDSAARECTAAGSRRRPIAQTTGDEARVAESDEAARDAAAGGRAACANADAEPRSSSSCSDAEASGAAAACADAEADGTARTARARAHAHPDAASFGLCNLHRRSFCTGAQQPCRSEPRGAVPSPRRHSVGPRMLGGASLSRGEGGSANCSLMPLPEGYDRRVIAYQPPPDFNRDRVEAVLSPSTRVS